MRVEGAYSDWEDVESSVVQGSVLGGPLFTIYIDDMTEEAREEILKILMKIFADDTKVAKLVESLKDREEMQKTIEKLAAWAAKWEMRFNVNKCKVLHVGSKNPRYEYTLNGEKIATANEEKDLGIWMDTSLKPTKQCTVAARSANFALGQIQRAFHYRRKSNLVPLYKSFVRPKLEFAVAAWCPWQEGDIKVLERVQERLIRMISDVQGATYDEKLRDAGLTTLKERRTKGDLIEAYKTLKGFNRVDRPKWFTEVGTDARRTRMTTVSEEGEERRENVLKEEFARLEVRKNFFNVRVVRQWNALPDDVRKQTSVNTVKNAYDRWKDQQSH